LKAVFLDRDGVLNEDRDDYVKNVAELEVFPYVPQAIRRLNEAGFEVIVISNQQGVAKGLISESDLQAIQSEITRQVCEGGGRIAAFYYCRHLATDGCACRKPKPGLLQLAAKENDIDLGKTFMIGDSERDVLAGQCAGCRTVLVLSGMFTREDAERLPRQPEHIADNLAAAVDYVIAHLY